VWVAAAAGAVLVGIFADTTYLTWIPVVLGACVLLTFAIQLGLQRKEGFVTRVMASIGGALVILAVTTGVLAVLHPAGLSFA
jgi:hypothetical protein